MGVLWERLAGDTSKFALKVSFLDDPDSGESLAPELAASWGGFQIWVNGSNLCEHQEPGVAGSIREVNWYLLPLLEWFAAHWEPLFHEERLPGRVAASDAWSSLHLTGPGRGSAPLPEAETVAQWARWAQAHCLISAREGGLFPDLVIRRTQEWAELSWGETRLAGMPRDYRFTVKTGTALLPVESVAQAVFNVLEAAADYLASRCPDSDRVRRLRTVLRDIGSPANAGWRLALLAGIGERSPERARRWSRLTNRLAKDHGKPALDRMLETQPTRLVTGGCCHAQMMFGSLTPNLSDSDWLQVAGLVIDQWGRQLPSDPLRDVAVSVPYEPSTPRAWEQGYELAEAFLAAVNEGGTETPDLDAILKRCGVDYRAITLEDTTTRGLAVAGPRHRPLVAVNRSHPTSKFPSGRRFTIAHEICHLLHDRTSSKELAMASGPWAPMGVEQRANAFAAMILMPRDAVQKAIGALSHPVPKNDDIMQIAEMLQVSRTALLWHLRNLGFIDDSIREAIELESEHSGRSA